MRTLIFNLFLAFSILYSQPKYKHILITNDDGIEDAKRLMALAQSVAEVSEKVSVIVSAFDRSGTSNHSLYGKYNSTFEVTCEYNEDNISFYTIPGNPADCVMLGLGGLSGENKPDLVLSGINGGSNIAAGWFGSGTIGAIRTAAFYGVKGIALSGFDDDNEDSFSVIPNWITEFISTDFIDNLEKNSYLTIGFPKVPLENIKGVKLSERKVVLDDLDVFKFRKIWGEDPNIVDSKTIWTVEILGNPYNHNKKLDDYYLSEGYIVITPMTIDENNADLFAKYSSKIDSMPDFTTTE